MLCSAWHKLIHHPVAQHGRQEAELQKRAVERKCVYVRDCRVKRRSQGAAGVGVSRQRNHNDIDTATALLCLSCFGPLYPLPLAFVLSVPCVLNTEPSFQPIACLFDPFLLSITSLPLPNLPLAQHGPSPRPPFSRSQLPVLAGPHRSLIASLATRPSIHSHIHIPLAKHYINPLHLPWISFPPPPLPLSLLHRHLRLFCLAVPSPSFLPRVPLLLHIQSFACSTRSLIPPSPVLCFNPS